MIHFFQALKTAPRKMFTALAEGWGRAQDTETRYLLGNPDYLEQAKGTQRFFELALNPYIFAGMRYRDVSRLWVSAHGLDKDDDGAYAPAQIIFPPYAETVDDQMLRFVQWNFDERLTRSMKSIIQQMQYSVLTYGRSIQEIDWQRQEGGKYAGRIVINDVWDRDPDRFVLNPKGLTPGIYLKRSVFSNVVDPADRMPDRKFMVMTNRKYFENLYGISELRPLDSVAAILEKVWGFWARGLEKAGKGSLIGYYSNKLLGNGNEKGRATFLEEIQKIASETATVTHTDNRVETLKPEFEAAAFSEFVSTAISQISLVLTGSSTALQEGKYGSYSKEESTTVRQKSDIEQLDAAAISEAFNFQLIPWLIDWNVADVQAYPTMYLIQPERITPTTPKDQQQDPIGVMPEEEEQASVETLPGDVDAIGKKKVVEMAEEDNPAMEETTQPTAQTVKPDLSFFPAPEIFSEPEVIQAGKEFVESMPALADDDFQKLPESKRYGAFTIAKVGDRAGLEKVIAELRDEIAATIDEPDEEKAFLRYYPKARAILRGSGATVLSASELLVSFRVTRQKAYNEGILTYAENNADALHGLQWKTQEDTRVRRHHRVWNNITRPVDDPIWREMQPPIDFNCRCYLQPIRKADAAKYPYTPTDKVPRNRDTF